MSNIVIKPISSFKGTISVPGDKSISHRAVMIGALAEGTTRVSNFLYSQDCLRTIEAFRDLGVEIEEHPEKHSLVIKGKGLEGLRQPKKTIYLGNSGTSMRLLLGILAGQSFQSSLSGDESLSRRPMKRVTHPLRLMGAKIQGKDDANFAPLTIKGGKLKSIRYSSEIPSAQVKSAILLAGLYAHGLTEISEPFKSRDHTERMLKHFSAELKVKGLSVSLKDHPRLLAKDIEIPGDISSASFFLVAASLISNSSIRIKDIGINPTRSGIIDVLKAMGADIKIEAKRSLKENFEPFADILIKTSPLKGVVLEADLIPRAIDELPLLMVAGSQASGQTIIKKAGELRLKETDRINSMLTNLNKMGARITLKADDIIIQGDRPLKGARVNSFGDHRTAMSMVIAALSASGESVIENTDCIDISFPGFMDRLKALIT